MACRWSTRCSASTPNFRPATVVSAKILTAAPKRPAPPSKFLLRSRNFARKCDMGKRRKAREAAVQYHFWRDLQRGETPENLADFWEFCPGTPRIREFATPL